LLFQPNAALSMSGFYAIFALVCIGFAAAGRVKSGIHGLRDFHTPLTLDERREACKNICNRHGTLTAEERECQTECYVKVDVASSDAHRLREFAGESPTRLRRYEKTTGHDVKQCRPLAHVEMVYFGDLDLNHDKQVSLQELKAFTDLLCIPEDTANSMFDAGDGNHDGMITEKEWNSSGEDTEFEYQVDKFSDKHVEPQPEPPEDVARNALADLIGEVKAPPFKSLDKNGDGVLNDWEMVGAFMREIMMRNPNMDVGARRIIQTRLFTKMPGIFEALDKNHDHRLSPEEYEVKKKGGDFGHEMLEAAETSKDQRKDEASTA